MLCPPGFVPASFLPPGMLFPGLVLLACALTSSGSSLIVTSSVRPSLDSWSTPPAYRQLTSHVLARSACSCARTAEGHAAHLLTQAGHRVSTPTWMQAPGE